MASSWQISESYSRIPFAYRCQRHSWFLRCQCRIPKCFLNSRDEAGLRFFLGPYFWLLRCIHGQDGKLSVYLECLNCPPTIGAHYGCSIKHRRSAGDDQSYGWARFFSSPSSPVLCLACPSESIKIESYGFLDNNFFLMQLDVRLILQENELFIQATPKPAQCVLQWQLNQLFEFSPKLLVSERITVNKTEWRLFLYPRGENGDASTIAVFLQSFNLQSVAVQFEFSIYNYIDAASIIRKEKTCVFSGAREMDGWSVFMNNASIQSSACGFVHDGWCTCQARILILDRNPEPSVESHEFDVLTDVVFSDSSLDSVRPLH